MPANTPPKPPMHGSYGMRDRDIQLPSRGRQDPRLRGSSPLEGLRQAGKRLKDKGINLPNNITGVRG